MNNKEILQELLKKALGDRLLKLEKENNEAESALKLIKASYDGFKKKLQTLAKLREQKIAKDKLEEQKKLAAKKAEEARKAKKKEGNSRAGLKPNKNTTSKKTDRNFDKKNTFIKNKSTATLKKPGERPRGKSVARLNTEKSDTSRNTIGANHMRRKSLGIKKDTQPSEAHRRNTIGGARKKSLKPSRSMGKLLNKPTLKKASNPDDEKKKKEIEEMQKMVNNIKIQNKDEELEKEKDLKENLEEKKEEIKVEIKIIPPTFMSCYKEGILEKSIIQFLTEKEKINLFSCNKAFAPLAISIFKDKISYYKKVCDIFIGETMDSKIKSLESKYSEEELNAPIKQYEMGKGCIKAMGLLKEDLYLRVFLRVPPEKTLEEISIVYRLFCQLLKLDDLIQIKDDKIFFEKFSKYVLENKGEEKLNDFCIKCSSQFNFDDKNILKLKEISKNKMEKLKPGYFNKICGTTGLFFFLIKDCLEYCGAIEDKKTPGNRIKANYLYQKSLFDLLNKFIKFLEGLTVKKEE
jgi:hypothetical protein